MSDQLIEKLTNEVNSYQLKTNEGFNTKYRVKAHNTLVDSLMKAYIVKALQVVIDKFTEKPNDV